MCRQASRNAQLSRLQTIKDCVLQQTTCLISCMNKNRSGWATTNIGQLHDPTNPNYCCIMLMADLKPKRHFCDDIEHCWQHECTTYLQQLCDAILSTWTSIPVECLKPRIYDLKTSGSFRGNGCAVSKISISNKVAS